MSFALFIYFSFFAGCGFIGRHLVEYLVSNNLVSKVSIHMSKLNHHNTFLCDC